MRATYLKAGEAHDVLGIDPGPNPTVTVRVRATEFEKRATNANTQDVAGEFAKAPWLKTPRGYVLDFRFRWTGSEWEQVGEPAAHPTLGNVGRLSMMQLLDVRR
jgi:hypothetical protein